MGWSGGYFRNFLLKYKEANWMHKRMLYVSKEIDKVTKSGSHKVASKGNKNARLSKARRHLYMGQTNDAYWHGVFGGLYLNYLRGSVYSHLIEAEKLINKKGRYKLNMLDLDCDGQDEIILSSGHLWCVFSPHRGGTLSELDYKPKSVNFINTLMRRPETYHQKIKQNVINARDTSDQPQSIHHLDRIKESGLEGFLFYDLFQRQCCLDHFLNKQTKPEQFFRCEYEELGDFIQGKYELNLKNKTKNRIGLKLTRLGKVSDHSISITKEINLSNSNLTLSYSIKNQSSTHLDNLFGIEFNLSVYDKRLSLTSSEIKTDYLRINDIWSNSSLDFTLSALSSVWHFPVVTVSDSEAGIEKTYQELCLLFNWQLDIAPDCDWLIRLGLRIK